MEKKIEIKLNPTHRRYFEEFRKHLKDLKVKIMPHQEKFLKNQTNYTVGGRRMEFGIFQSMVMSNHKLINDAINRLAEQESFCVGEIYFSSINEGRRAERSFPTRFPLSYKNKYQLALYKYYIKKRDG